MSGTQPKTVHDNMNKALAPPVAHKTPPMCLCSVGIIWNVRHFPVNRHCFPQVATFNDCVLDLDVILLHGPWMPVGLPAVGEKLPVYLSVLID